MKKIHILLAGIFLLLLTSGVVFADASTPKLEIANVEAESGAEIEVPITLSDNGGILGVTLTVSYDNALTLKGVNKGTALSTLVMTKPGDFGMNPVKILWDGEQDDDSNGVIATLVFAAPKAGGVFPVVITYEDGDIIDSNVSPISVEITNGSITVQDKRTDQERADEVIAKINQIDLSDKASVEKARQMYNALSDEQKALIGADVLKKLTDAEESIRAMEDDQQKANEVGQIIREMDATDKDSVKNARASYDSLTNEQKAMVPADLLKKLTDAEQAIQKLEEQEQQDQVAAEAVIELINKLPKQAELKDEAAISDARKQYDALTNSQKKLVDKELLSKLEAAEKQIKGAKAEAQKSEEEKKADEKAAAIVSGKIAALPDQLTIAYEQDVQEAREAFEQLSDDQKQLLTEETLNKLSIAETNIEEIKDAMEQIQGSAPGEEDIQKAKEEKEEADKAAAEKIEKQLNDLPETAALTDEEAVTQARIAYEILTSAQKERVSEDAVTKLNNAEKQVETAKNAGTSGSGTAGSGDKGQGSQGSSSGTAQQVKGSGTVNDAAYNKAVSAARKMAVKGLKVKVQKNRKAKVTWKVNKKVSGYQIQYSTNKKFKKANKVLTIKKKSKKSAVLKKLKAGKVYYVRIRPYVIIKDANGVNHETYGKWSRAKRIKARK